MAAKSIIDIEINDGPWQRFNRQVAAHRKTLSEMPGQWGAVGKSLQKAESAAARFVARVQEQARALREANGLSAKMTVTLKASDRFVSSMARGTVAIARNLKDATKSLLSWAGVMGLISGVLGAGGLFGIARMAQNVSGGQSSAMRTGSTYGGTKAAWIAYGQLLGGPGGVESLLSTMAKEKESGGVMFRRMGLRDEQWKNKPPTEILAPFLRAVQEAYRKAPKGAEAKAMEALAPELDFNTIKQLSQTNIDTLDTFYRMKKRELELSEQTQDAWSRFNRVLDASGEKLENTFVRALTPLTPALAAFAEGMNKAIATILGHPMIKNMIAGAGKALEKGANYLLSDQFSKDFKSFLEEMRKIGKAMSETADVLHKVFGTESIEEKRDRMLTDFGGPKREIVLGGDQKQGSKGDVVIGRVKASDVRVDVHVFTPAGSNLTAQAHAAAR
jgi:hypothetical protein